MVVNLGQLNVEVDDLEVQRSSTKDMPGTVILFYLRIFIQDGYICITYRDMFWGHLSSQCLFYLSVLPCLVGFEPMNGVKTKRWITHKIHLDLL